MEDIEFIRQLDLDEAVKLLVQLPDSTQKLDLLHLLDNSVSEEICSLEISYFDNYDQKTKQELSILENVQLITITRVA